MKTKKLLSAMLILTLAFPFAACKKEETPETTTTVPAADNNDATSAQGEQSSSGSGSNNSNGSIATGDYSAAAIFGVFAIAGLGVFYFVRKRRSSK